MARLKLVLQYFQSNSESISNGICIVLALVSVKLYTSFDFNCPCLPQYNKLYSLGVMVVPPIILFFLGVLINRHTGVMMDEWMRPVGNRSKNPARAFALLGSIAGRAAVAPLTWVIISLLQGQTLEGFPTGQGSEVMAKFLCPGIPAELQSFWLHIKRQLMYESQLIGWLLVAGMVLMTFLVQCVKHCTSPLSHRQEDYWSQYRSNEKTLFECTACAHARIVAAHNIRSFFGFVVPEQEEKEELMEHQNAAGPICSTNWDRVTGVYLYREKNGLPLYSRLNKRRHLQSRE
uniref:Calcium homeostasis modulator 3 n=1 Tax=Nothobranchius furzeri TaxID=105023 RepID=A0A8C6KI27_NOTFU